MAGSRILEGYRPPYTATSVANLQDAGIQVLGKTNQDEFAMGSSNENSGFGPVQNPWDRTRVPGRLLRRQRRGRGRRHRALGDRHRHRRLDPPAGQPLRASSGMKPTYGAVSRYGMIAFASSLDQCGPLTRDVTDAAMLLQPPRRAATRATPRRSASRAAIALPTAERLDGLRFGIRRSMEERGSSRAWPSSVRATLAKIEELGGSVEEIELPHAGHGIAAYYVIAPAEASANLARFDGVRYGQRADGDGDLTSLYEQTRAEGFGDGGQAPHHARHVRALVGLLRGLLRHGAEGAHARSPRTSRRLREGRPHRLPDLADGRVRLGERTDDPLAMYLSDFCTVPMPLAGIPAISIPGGLSEGLPVGIQLAGPAFSENRILDAAHALEQAIGFEGLPRGVSRATTSRSSASRSTSSCATRTKMFCGCALSFGDEPNTHTCPVCLGHPGTLPVTNAEAVHFGADDRDGARLRDRAAVDLPPQELLLSRPAQGLPDQPVRHPALRRAAGSATCASTACTWRRTRPSSSTRASSGRIHGAEASVVDFNRGGTPLVEIVTEPDLRSAAEAAELARLLRATLRRLGVSDVNMEEGSLRWTRNVSIRPVGDARARHEDRAEEHELVPLPRARHRGRDRAPGGDRRARAARSSRRRSTSTPQSGALTSLRSKEEAHDYRYFPEPDLVPLAPTEEMLERARAAMPELPAARAERLERDLGLPADKAKLLAFRTELGDFFEAAVAAGGDGDARAIANWVTDELAARLGDAEPAESKVEPAALRRAGGAGRAREVAASAAKEVLDALVAEGGDPAAIVEQKGLGMAGGDELEEIVDRAMADNPTPSRRSGRATRGDRRHRGRGDEGDQGPRRRRRGPAADQREARRLSGPPGRIREDACLD